MATLGERLKQLRKEKGLTQRKLAEILNLDDSSISMYERGKTSPPDDIKIKLANFFGVSVDYLLGISNNRDKDTSLPKSIDTVPVGKLLQIPIIGTIKAGPGGIAYEELLGYEMVDAELFKGCENCFFLRVKGNSMEPLLLEGDLVLIRRQPDVPSNSLAAVIINGEEAMIKKVIKKEKEIILQSINPEYEPVVIKEGDEFYIVGLATALTRKFYYY